MNAPNSEIQAAAEFDCTSWRHFFAAAFLVVSLDITADAQPLTFNDANPTTADLFVHSAAIDGNKVLIGAHSEPMEDSPPPLLSSSTPLVYAGPDITVEFTDSAVLNGEVVSNTGESLAIHWSVVSGPGIATFAEPNFPVTTVNFSALGVYELELTASDVFGTASDRVQVDVIPIPEPCSGSLALCSAFLLLFLSSRRRQQI
jgi:hypothetical protein